MQRSTKVILIASGLVVAACIMAVGIANLLSPPEAVSVDGMAGIKDDFIFAKRLVGYGAIAIGGSFVIAALSIAIRMFAGALTPLATGLSAWIKSLAVEIAAAIKPAPLALETVLGVKDGKPFTLQDALRSATTKIKTVEADLAAVMARTAHIEPPPPPPPPKTAEEIADEQAKVIAALQSKLAAIEAEQNAKSATAETKPATAEVAT